MMFYFKFYTFTIINNVNTWLGVTIGEYEQSKQIAESEVFVIPSHFGWTRLAREGHERCTRGAREVHERCTRGAQEGHKRGTRGALEGHFHGL